MRGSETARKKDVSPFLLCGKSLSIAAGMYIIISILFLSISRYYMGALESIEYIVYHLSLSYIIITVAAMIFPILLALKKKILVAIIVVVLELIAIPLALFWSLQMSEITNGIWYVTLTLPIVLFLPYIWCFIKRLSTKE